MTLQNSILQDLLEANIKNTLKRDQPNSKNIDSLVLLNIMTQMQFLVQGALNHPLPQAGAYSKEGFILNMPHFFCSALFIYFFAIIIIINHLLLDTLGENNSNQTLTLKHSSLHAQCLLARLSTDSLRPGKPASRTSWGGRQPAYLASRCRQWLGDMGLY